MDNLSTHNTQTENICILLVIYLLKIRANDTRKSAQTYMWTFGEGLQGDLCFPSGRFDPISGRFFSGIFSTTKFLF